MNLIRDPWIPICRKNGVREKITPWQITEGFGTDREITDLAAVRPDFNGANVQFLIGLLQTVCAPKSNSEWRKWLNEPPVPETLREKFKTVEHAFNLDGDGPRFMQEHISKESTQKYIEMILLGNPQENTRKKNTDFFIKRNRSKILCGNCIASALFSLQLNAPANGYFRSGIRFGGPVTSIIKKRQSKGSLLWETCWLNVINENYFQSYDSMQLDKPEDTFPWMTNKIKKTVTIQDIHPYQVYWGMPRRLYIDFKNVNNKSCDICAEEKNKVLYSESFFEDTYGVSYEGIFPHPLSPVQFNKDNMPFPISVESIRGQLGYRHWIGFVVNNNNSDNKGVPAAVIAKQTQLLSEALVLQSFGYCMKKMNVLGWQESLMPVFYFEDKNHDTLFRAKILAFVTVAKLINDLIVENVTAAKYKREKEKKRMSKKIETIVAGKFWQETESEFYHQMSLLRDDIIKGGNGLIVCQTWHGYLVKTAETIFNDTSQADLLDLVDARRISKAWNDLRRGLYSKKIMTEILGLPQTGI